MTVYLTGMRKNCDLAIYIDVPKAISGKSNDWLYPYVWVKRLISAKKRSPDPAFHSILDGIRFFLSENGVLLTPGDSEGKLAPCYFCRALRLKPSRKLLMFICLVSLNICYTKRLRIIWHVIYLYSLSFELFICQHILSLQVVNFNWSSLFLTSFTMQLQQFLTLCSG